MKKLFIQVILLLVISFSLFFLLKVTLIGRQKKNYNSAFVDKLKMLHANRFTRKIVLVGGSSVGWGLSAELIEKSLGIKTINLGHHAGLGLIDFEPFLMKNITKDDIIIFSPEWKFYGEPTSVDAATLEDLIKYNREYGILLNNDDYVRKAFFSEIKLNIFEPDYSTTPYRYNCINGNGDIISQCNLKVIGPSECVWDTMALKIDSFPTCFEFLKTNKTYFLFPPTQQRAYNKYKNYLATIEDTLRTKNYHVIDHVIDNVYPQSSFFDAEYHLTCDARANRTEKLITYLKEVLQKQQ